ncbi:tRNA-dihydrouridine synthase [Patescibacteria group bacterium]|nr:tRNA-dihydrouridine synthase [Patescibacteria group bacterium]MBU4580560.1 tRNA-dihydrouridine synthase [Patescibacteria group bacterium]
MQNFWKKLKRPIIALAPMAGITDQPFRQICKGYGADVVYSEMASASAIFYNKKKTLGITRFNSQKESPYVAQLFGDKPEHFLFAAKVIARQIRPDGIDINFGCPARKIIACNAGAALMNNISLAREIIEATLEGVSSPPSPKGYGEIKKIPVSIKIRSGVKKTTALNFIKKIKDLPIAAIMVHGRTLEQGFAGEIDYDMIKNIKKEVGEKIIVLANGGILKPEDAKTMLEKTGADGIGLAQGVLGKPWLFKQIKDFLQTGSYREFELSEIKGVAIKHAEMMYKKRGKQGVVEMRKHLAWYFKGFSGAAELRRKLVHVKTISEIKKILK